MTDNLKVKDLPQEDQDLLIKEAQEYELKGNFSEYKVSTLKAKIAEKSAGGDSNSGQEPEKFENIEYLELPPKIEPYMWLKVKIIGIIPAGSDPNYPYNRYKLDISGTGEIVMSEAFVRALFADTGIIGTFTESFDETLLRLESEG